MAHAVISIMKECPVLRPHLANASVFLPYAQDPFGQPGLFVDVQYGANDTYGEIIQQQHTRRSDWVVLKQRPLVRPSTRAHVVLRVPVVVVMLCFCSQSAHI